MRGRKKLSLNAERRALARAEEKLARARERLAKLDAGGAPTHPIEIVSASLVETQARSALCPKCLGPSRVDDHTAVTLEGKRLRVAHLTCTRCGAQRALYFRIVGDALN